MDYGAERRTILMSQNVIWQLEREKIAILPMILNLQNIYTITSNFGTTGQSWRTLLSIQPKTRKNIEVTN